MVEEISREIEGPVAGPTLVGTGWYAEPPVKTERSFGLWEPQLALQGLYRIALKNRG
ncbi:MAG: hypothetical protein LDL24_12430 [Treponema sp.]|nr:hypothetical protein [Treponema sp.]